MLPFPGKNNKKVDTLGNRLENGSIRDDKGVDVGSSATKESIKLGKNFDIL